MVDGEARGKFKTSVGSINHRLVQVGNLSAVAASEMMVRLGSQFIRKMAILGGSPPHEAVAYQELKRPVDRGLGKTGQVAPGLREYLRGKHVPRRVAKHVEDRQTL
jgi:hypothetical protein